jgi:hypothetical protein
VRAVGQSLVEGGTDGRADQVHGEQERVGVDGALGHLPEHAHGQHLVADAQQAGGRQQDRRAATVKRHLHGWTAERRRRRHRRGAPEPPRQRRASEVRGGAQHGGTQQAPVRNDDEHGQQQAEHRAGGVGRVESAEAAARGAQLALQRGQRGAHRRAGGQQQDERQDEGDRPVPWHRRFGSDEQPRGPYQRRHGDRDAQPPGGQQQFAAGVPAPGPAAAREGVAHQSRAQREPAEEGGEHRQHGDDLVTHGGAELRRPDHLPCQRSGAGQAHQQMGQGEFQSRALPGAACGHRDGGRSTVRSAPGFF